MYFTAFNRDVQITYIVCVRTIMHKLTFVSVRALIVAVRVQLYKIASSPKSFPGPMVPRSSPRIVTCTSPSSDVKLKQNHHTTLDMCLALVICYHAAILFSETLMLKYMYVVFGVYMYT